MWPAPTPPDPRRCSSRRTATPDRGRSRIQPPVQQCLGASAGTLHQHGQSAAVSRGCLDVVETNREHAGCVWLRRSIHHRVLAPRSVTGLALQPERHVGWSRHELRSCAGGVWPGDTGGLSRQSRHKPPTRTRTARHARQMPIWIWGLLRFIGPSAVVARSFESTWRCANSRQPPTGAPLSCASPPHPRTRDGRRRRGLLGLLARESATALRSMAHDASRKWHRRARHAQSRQQGLGTRPGR